jgi:hypothetical protein
MLVSGLGSHVAVTVAAAAGLADASNRIATTPIAAQRASDERADV